MGTSLSPIANAGFANKNKSKLVKEIRQYLYKNSNPPIHHVGLNSPELESVIPVFYDEEPDSISFEDNSFFSPWIYKNVSECMSSLRYWHILNPEELYYSNKYSFSWRWDLYTLVRLLGGNEVLYLADNSHYLDFSSLIDKGGITYLEIKAAVTEIYGPPIKLLDQKLNQKEFYLKNRIWFYDDFEDFK